MFLFMIQSQEKKNTFNFTFFVKCSSDWRLPDRCC